MKTEKIAYLNQESTRIVMGGDSFGNGISEADSMRMLDAYRASGGNHIDTAHLYGIGGSGGEQICEKMIGKWMKSRNVRAEIILSTKGGHPPLSDLHASRIREKELRKDLEESLSALDTDYIDLYWLHRDNPSMPVAEIMEWLFSYIKEGKVRAIGASNWSGARIEEANQYAREHGLREFSASQILFSAARPSYIPDDTLIEMNETELDYYRKSSLPVLGYSSQGKGYFSKLAVGAEITGMAKEWFDSVANRKRFSVIQSIAEEKKTSVSSVVLAFLWSGEVRGLPIIGPKNLTQLCECLSASEVELSREEWNAVWTGEWA